MSRDNGHCKKFLSLARSNIVGTKGIQLECNARLLSGEPNIRINKLVENAFWEWGHAETCTLSGKLDWIALQKLVVTQWARDGEYLVQMLPHDNQFGFTLKVWDVNWLDETYNETRQDGHRVIMSVEFDANDRPVAYWLTTPASEITYSIHRNRERVRIPAEQIVHGFLVTDDETQARGVTWFHAAMLNAKNYQGYEEGVIQSARFYSNIPIFIEQAVADGEEFTGAETDDGTPTQPDIDVSTLAVNILNPGQKFNQLDPKQPTQNHSEFAKTVMQGLAASLDVPYFYLAGDMEAVNFSSSRVGLDDARDIWRGLQDQLASTLCRRVFHEWLRSALLHGRLTLTPREYAEVQNPLWRGRGWKYIDPTKDIAADLERLRGRLITPSQILSEQGEDWEDHLIRWDQDRKLAAKYGMDIDDIYAPNSGVGATQVSSEIDEDEMSGSNDKKPRSFTAPAVTSSNNGHRH